LFWSRLGSKTPDHPSGSVEEIFRLVEKGARVMVYFCDRPVPQKALKDGQYAKLQEFKETMNERGLLGEFSDIASLKERVTAHLTGLVTQMVMQDKNLGPTIPSSGTVTAPTPDVRVSLGTGIAI